MAILKPKRVLVTGHRGYIGSALVEKLKNIGLSALPWDHYTPTKLTPATFALTEGI